MKRVQMTLALTAMLAVGTAQAADFSSWQKKMKVTFAGYTQTGTLTNFPALVVLSTSINGFSYGDFKSLTNQDLRFTASDGTSELNYEIESWNTNGSSYVWLQVTNLVDANTFVYSYWGKSGTNAPAYTTNGAVWDANYRGVWHMQTTNAADSTTNHFNGSPSGNTNATGVINGGQGFDGSNNRNISLSSSISTGINGGNAITVMAWANLHAASGQYQGIITEMYSGDGNVVYELFADSGKLSAGFYDGAWHQIAEGTTLPLDQWHHVASTYDGHYIRVYRNGVQVAISTSLGDLNKVLPTGTNPWEIGHRHDGSDTWNGLIDEARISRNVCSSNWIWASWMNQASNGVFTGSFNTYGAVQATDPNLPQVSNGPVQNRTDSSADVVGTLITNGTSAATVYLYWSTTDGMTNTSTWLTPPGSVSNLGACVDGTIFTNTLTGLTPNTKYYWNYSASNLSGMAWAATAGSPYFKTMGVPGVDNGGGATSIGPNSATLRGTLTNGASAHVYFHWGNAPDNLPNTLDVGTVSEVPFSQNLTGLDRATTYYYAACASNVYGGEVTVPATNFTTLPYVWITVSTNLVESQTNLWNGVPVVVDGSGVVLTLSNSATYGVLPQYEFGNLILTNGAAIVCLSQNGMSPYTITNTGVAIHSTGDLVVAGGCNINADLAGFGNRNGPGAATGDWAGGTHGGKGINNSSALYGSATAPITLGGSGREGYGTASSGGGAIKLVVAGNLVLNGRVSANGQGNNRWACGGGAGGSIWITGGCTLGGTGEVQTSGAPGPYSCDGEGGGGHISIDDTVIYNFRGNVRGSNGPLLGNIDAYPPGALGDYGSAGTVYFPASARQDFTVWSNQIIIVGNAIENVFSNLTVYGTLIPCGSYAGQGTGCVIRATNLTVATGGQITAEGWGFSNGAGPAPGGQGSHGGRGYGNANALYGAVTNPTSMGSGGGGPGGGAIILAVSGSLVVNGTVNANGWAEHGGSQGAGGSIWITGGGTINGRGTLTATSPGQYYPGSAGGGRISIDDTMTYTFLGNILAGGVYDGTPGTVYLPASARQNFTVETNQTFVIGNGTTYNFGALTVKGTLDCGGDWLGPIGGTGIVITADSLTIATNGVIKANGRGFYNGQGPAAGSQTVGATHSGAGYNNAAAAYGSATQPTTLGSGGYQEVGTSGSGYSGGGAIRLVVRNALTIYGALSANGGVHNNNGGSAGGSIWIDAGTLAGNGSIRADGGGGTAGGGGGRIAIKYRGKSLFTGTPAPGLYTNLQTISSTVTVKGGYNTSGDGPEDGSIYIEAVPQGTTFFFR